MVKWYQYIIVDKIEGWIPYMGHTLRSSAEVTGKKRYMGRIARKVIWQEAGGSREKKIEMKTNF